MVEDIVEAIRIGTATVLILLALAPLVMAFLAAAGIPTPIDGLKVYIWNVTVLLVIDALVGPPLLNAGLSLLKSSQEYY